MAIVGWSNADDGDATYLPLKLDSMRLELQNPQSYCLVVAMHLVPENYCNLMVSSFKVWAQCWLQGSTSPLVVS